MTDFSKFTQDDILNFISCRELGIWGNSLYIKILPEDIDDNLIDTIAYHLGNIINTCTYAWAGDFSIKDGYLYRSWYTKGNPNLSQREVETSILNYISDNFM